MKSEMARKVLVTGGCGYIGGKLVPALLAQGWDVRVLDALYFGNRLPDAAARHPGFTLIVGDIRDATCVARALEGVDAVVHLAAMANDPSAELDAALTRQINLEASLQLLQRARQQGVRRFVNASTATVYGVREEPDVDETFDHRPITLYGKYKSETDKAAAGMNDATFTAVNLRAATVCGWSPRMRLDLTVNILSEQAKNRGLVTVHGGAQMRPNIVIDDLVCAYLRLLEAPAPIVGGQSYNIGASNRSVLQIAEAVVRTVNPAARIEIAPIFDNRSYHISTRKAAEALGFRPQYDVEDGASQVGEAISDGRLAAPHEVRYRNVATVRNLIDSRQIAI
jgi:nucleoside-diphosphate-sugar epimerase